MAGPDRLGELLRALRGTAQKRLHSLASEMFDRLDDALFELAEKSDNSATQTKFFDGMREVRKKRPAMEQSFVDGIVQGFATFASGNPVKRDEQSAGAELSLVEEGDLEEGLAFSSMVGKAENRLARGIYALNQRLGVLCGGKVVDDTVNPVSPKAVTEAFRIGLRLVDVELPVKLFILKLFDKHVMSGLDLFCDELNQVLVDGGVLPQLKHQVGIRRPPGSGAASGMGQQDSDAASSEMAPNGMPPIGAEAVGNPLAGGFPGAAGMASGSQLLAGNQAYGGNENAAMQWEIYNTLRSLLSARHGGQAQNQPVQSGPMLGANDILNALTLLQNQHLQTPLTANYFGGPPISYVQQVKGELLQQVGKLGGMEDAQSRVTSADEDTIDLVGMLFEYILQDRNLPAEIQALLARLQIPFLKVAILDKHLFAKKEHPARRLLDELAQAGVSWSEENDKDRRLFDQIKSTVETLLREFDDDIKIFERMHRELIDFLNHNRKRAEIAEARTTEAVRGREKLQNARKSAAKEILSRMDGKQLPEVIRHILTRPWANVLVLTILRQGENTPQWKAALRIADELVWSCQPKEMPNDRARLRALVPELDKAIKQGLALVAYPESDVRQLLSDLHFLYGEVLESKAPAAVVVESLSDDDGGFVIEHKAITPRLPMIPRPGAQEESFVETHADRNVPEEDEDQGPEDDYFAMARNVKVGVWVEFRDERGGVERAKLSWVSPISSKFLFVNRKGLKVADKTVWGLAAELRKGSAVILEDVPLFDRALDAIVERLRTSDSAA